VKSDGWPVKKTTVAIGCGEDRIEALYKAFRALGGIGKWVKPGMNVLLKPNVMTAMGTPGVTHIDMLKGLAQLCKEAGAREIMVGENPVCGMPSRKHFELSGYDTALESIGCKVVYFDEEPWVYKVQLDNFCLKDMHVPKSLADADVWITVPVAKTHIACVTTLGLKNSHGILPDEDKARHHRGRAHAGTSLWEKFVDITHACPPHLCVTDMFHAMEGQGPAFGDVVEMKLVVAGEDVVACDAVVEELMGIDSMRESPLIGIAHRRGVGMGDISGIEVVGEKIENHRKKFRRAIWRPDENAPQGLVMLVGDVCYGGCQMILSYLIDVSRFTAAKDAREFGPVYVLCGENPPPPSESRFVLVFGDCAIYSTWHYDYRKKGKKIGPWWARRPGYVDVPGCCPVQLAWFRGYGKLLTGYATVASLTNGVEIVEAEEYTFAEGVPLEKNPRRWTWDNVFAARYAKEIAESNQPKYIYENESLKGDRIQGRNPLTVDRVNPDDFSSIYTVESYGKVMHRRHAP